MLRGSNETISLVMHLELIMSIALDQAVKGFSI